MSFEKLYYKGKEVKQDKRRKTKIMTILEMPKKRVGVRTVFMIAYEAYGRTKIVVDNDPRIKKIIVYAEA